MSRSLKILIAAVVALGAVGGYWKLALAPKREQAAQLEEQIALQEAKLAQTQSLIASYKDAKAEYRANYETVARLGKAVPADDDTRSLVVQIDAAAKRSGIDFDTINVNGASSGEGGVAPGAISVGAFSAMPFTFSFSGEFSTLGNFLSRLERFVSLKGDEIKVSGRLLRLESLEITPGDGGWPALNAQVGASSYIVPEGAEAQGTPAAPGATGSTATSADSTTTASTGSTSEADAR